MVLTCPPDNWMQNFIDLYEHQKLLLRNRLVSLSVQHHRKIMFLLTFGSYF